MNVWAALYRVIHTLQQTHSFILTSDADAWILWENHVNIMVTDATLAANVAWSSAAIVFAL